MSKRKYIGVDIYLALQREKTELKEYVDRIDAALDVAVMYAGVDGSHHKAWVIDQMVRALTKEKYADVIAEAKTGIDGPETYDWDNGVPP